MVYNRNRTNEYSSEYSGYSTRRNLSRSRDALNRYKLSRKRKSNSALKFVGLSLSIIVVIVLTIFGAYKFIQYRNDKKELEGYTNVQMKQDIYLDFSIIGKKTPFAIKGLTKQEVYDAILGSYDFNIKISNSNPEIDLFEMPKYGAKVEDTDYSKYFSKSNDNLGTGQEVKIENPLADITKTLHNLLCNPIHHNSPKPKPSKPLL